MEMISKLGHLARACFFLPLACTRLALRLAQLLCVRPRPAFSASPFAFSASRSAKLEDISTPGAQPARLPTRRLARLPARSRHASTACEVCAF